MNNNMFDVINCIDSGQEKTAVIEELSNPKFYLGHVSQINKLIAKMIDLGLIEERNKFLYVTSKGRNFYNNTEIKEI